MKKKNILKENHDFNRMIENIRPLRYKYFNIYIERETNDLYKFGISVGKKVGNAVTRNKIKRRIKDILDKKDYQNSFNCIIMVKKEIVDKTYQEIKLDLENALKKVNIYKGEENEKKFH